MKFIIEQHFKLSRINEKIMSADMRIKAAVFYNVSLRLINCLIMLVFNEYNILPLMISLSIPYKKNSTI